MRAYETRKRILVTGGAGFLGAHLIDRLLERGDEVVCVDNLFTGSKRGLHRLRTVQACDRIVMLEEGGIVADGTYEELMSGSLPFKRLADEARDPRLQVSV